MNGFESSSLTCADLAGLVVGVADHHPDRQGPDAPMCACCARPDPRDCSTTAGVDDLSSSFWGQKCVHKHLLLDERFPEIRIVLCCSCWDRCGSVGEVFDQLAEGRGEEPLSLLGEGAGFEPAGMEAQP